MIPEPSPADKRPAPPAQRAAVQTSTPGLWAIRSPADQPRDHRTPLPVLSPRTSDHARSPAVAWKIRPCNLSASVAGAPGAAPSTADHVERTGEYAAALTLRSNRERVDGQRGRPTQAGAGRRRRLDQAGQARRAEGGAQRSLPVRQRKKVQEVSRRMKIQNHRVPCQRQQTPGAATTVAALFVFEG